MTAGANTTNDERFREYLRKAHREVLSWPDWKRGLLGWQFPDTEDGEIRVDITDNSERKLPMIGGEIPECCGKPCPTAFCPECGQAMPLSALHSLHNYILTNLKRARFFLAKAEREVRVGNIQRGRLSVAKWERWELAVQDVLEHFEEIRKGRPRA